MTIDNGFVAMIVSVLLMVTLLLAILTAGNRYMTNRTRDEVDDVIEVKQKAGVIPTSGDILVIKEQLRDIRHKVGKVENLERQQIALAAKLDNGIRDRLDGVVAWQSTHERKIDEMQAEQIKISNRLSELLGMMGRWDGKDRRS